LPEDSRSRRFRRRSKGWGIRQMKKVKVRLGNGYEIIVGSGLLAAAGQQLKEIGFSDRLVIITDSVVRGLYGDALRQRLADEGFEAAVIEVPEGEEQKSLETAGRLYDELSGLHVERLTPVLALGGGVIGDLAGFVAATYLRGLPLVQIPTTLLAQADSSIGGKVAVDQGQIKNKIGAFYQPVLTVSDIDVLKTLSPRALSTGLAEVIKHAVIRDGKFFTYLEENLDGIRSFDDRVLERVISRSAEIKVEVVEQDERDLGLRNVLNYGHTVGHAIETVSGFRLWHGEAVALGMLVAGRMSVRLGFLAVDELARLEGLIARAGLPVEVPELEAERVIQAMQHDKKISGGKIKFVLLRSIGDVFVTDKVDPSLIREVLVE
jgi:3-dehydroquinate synthase